MDCITSCLDNRGIPFFSSDLAFYTILFHSFSVLSNTVFFSFAAHRGGCWINQKSSEEKTEGGHRKNGEGGEGGPNQSRKSIWGGVEIFNTINKQGESGGGLRGRARCRQDAELSCRGHPQDRALHRHCGALCCTVGLCWNMTGITVICQKSVRAELTRHFFFLLKLMKAMGPR